MPYGNSVVPPTPAYPPMPTGNYNAAAQTPRQQQSSFSSRRFLSSRPSGNSVRRIQNGRT